MSLNIINLNGPDKNLVFSSTIQKVFIERDENLFSGNLLYNFMKNAGFIEDASVKLTAEPISSVLIDGSTYGKGFKCTGTFSSTQLYSLFEFEKFNNEICTVGLQGVPWYFKSVMMNLKLDAQLDPNGKAPITMSFTKNVKSLRDVFDPNPWPRVGQVDPPAPWVPNSDVYALNPNLGHIADPDLTKLFTPSTSTYYNGNRQRSVAIATTATVNDDFIFVDTTASDLVVTMPDPSTMVGKIISVSATGNDNVNVKTSAAVLILEISGGHSASFVANATSWIILSQG